MKIIASFILGLLIWTTSAFAQDVPVLKGHVNDYANLLSNRQIDALDKRAFQFEKSRSDHPQVVFLTIPALPADTDIKEYANKVFHTWRLGQKDLNNGILFVVSMSPKKVRIEVGGGLEGDIPDARADQIISAIKSKLSGGDFNGAFDEALTKIISFIPAPEGAEATPVATQPKSAVTPVSVSKPEEGTSNGGVIAALLVIGGIVLIIFLSLKRLGNATDTPQEEKRDPFSYKGTPPNAGSGGFRPTPSSRDASRGPWMSQQPERHERTSPSTAGGAAAGAVSGFAGALAGGELAERARRQHEQEEAEERRELRRRQDEEDRAERRRREREREEEDRREREERRRRRERDEESSSSSSSSGWGSSSSSGSGSSDSGSSWSGGGGGDSFGGGSDSGF